MHDHVRDMLAEVGIGAPPNSASRRDTPKEVYFHPRFSYEKGRALHGLVRLLLERLDTPRTVIRDGQNVIVSLLDQPIRKVVCVAHEGMTVGQVAVHELALLQGREPDLVQIHFSRLPPTHEGGKGQRVITVLGNHEDIEGGGVLLVGGVVGASSPLADVTKEVVIAGGRVQGVGIIGAHRSFRRKFDQRVPRADEIPLEILYEDFRFMSTPLDSKAFGIRRSPKMGELLGIGRAA